MIDLSSAPAWAGWHVGPWGRAKEWRLHAPCGSNYTVGEISMLRAIELDLAYLEHRVRTLADFAAADAMHFGPQDALTLIAAMQVIERASKNFSVQIATRRIEHVGARDRND